MFSGQRFLITHIWLRGFGGAELNVLELATFLKENGATVDIFTHLLKDPLKQEFSKANISVITDFYYPFEVELYDFIIVSQSILPYSIIESLRHVHQTLPKFIFLHMAALESHILEQPYIHNLEMNISSGTFAISQEIVDKNLSRFFTEIPNLQYYPNLVPTEYMVELEVDSEDIKSILVISNHPPQELLDIQHLFKELGINVDYYGVWSENYERASVELFAKYDCVIGIGKNVQYCLVMGKPIYIYDHYKGPGFLNASNYSCSEKHNFSGRGFEENDKDAQDIVNEILRYFQDTRNYQQENLEIFRNKFLLINNLSKLLKTVKDYNKEILVFSEEYANYVKSMAILIRDTVVRLDNDVQNLWSAIREYTEENMKLQLEVSKQVEVINELMLIKNELDMVYSSRTYRLALFFRKLKNKIFPKKM